MSLSAARPDEPAEVSTEAARRVVVVVLRIGALLLGAGAATADVELTMRRVAASFGLADLQAIVAFGTIMVSYAPPGGDSEPITAIELVSERTADYTRLSAAAALARSLRAGTTSLADAQVELDRIAVRQSPWPSWLVLLAVAASAAFTTVLFGGGLVDAVATFVVGILVEPVVRLLDDSGLPPFFRSLIGPLVSALIVIAAAGLGLPINEGLVLTGSLLRFLPGSALVAGMRDLIDQSIMSGSARLAEALLLGAAVAAGLAIALRIGTLLGISIGLQTSGGEVWQIPVQAIAAGLACGFFAVRLGEPRESLLGASVAGAIGWAVYLVVHRATSDTAASTVAAGIAVGGIGRIFARRAQAPAIIWVVPASLPLVPGLLIVEGLLAANQTGVPLVLANAVLLGLLLGAGVAAADIILSTGRRVNRGLIAPLMQPVTSVVQRGIARVPRRGSGRDRSARGT